MTQPLLPCAVIVMAKAPVAGYAKTRLIPALGDNGAAALAERLLDRAMTHALAAALGPVDLCVAPDLNHPAFQRWLGEASEGFDGLSPPLRQAQALRQAQCERAGGAAPSLPVRTEPVEAPHPFALSLSKGLGPTEAHGQQTPHPGGTVTGSVQGEGDLGQRMARAFARWHPLAERVLMTGTDAPGLDATVLQRAATALDTADAVFVPALDGGYALIGLRHPAPSLFEDIAWSTASVMADTRERLAQAGLRHVELPPLPDIDEPADLVHLPAAWRA